MERETGIEPATNGLEGRDSTTELLPLEKNGGGGWIRTTVGLSPADLQSAAIDRSATPPDKEPRIGDAAPSLFGLEPAPGFEPRTCCLQDSCSTPELCRRLRVGDHNLSSDTTSGTPGSRHRGHRV